MGDFLRSSTALAGLKTSYWSTVLGAFYCPSRFDPQLRVSGSTLSNEYLGARGFSSDKLEDSKTLGPERCIISKVRLQRVLEDAEKLFGDEYTTKTMYEINADIIQPACMDAGLPFALIPNDVHDVPPEGTKFVFVTHAWGENFSTFVKAVVAAVKQMEQNDPGAELYLWICAFALFQSADSMVISSQLGDDPTAAPFTKALCKATHYLIVRSQEADIYSRIWCCWELYYAWCEGKLASGTFGIAGPNGFQLRPHEQVDIAAARASDL